MFKCSRSQTLSFFFSVGLSALLCVTDVKTADRSLCHSCKPVSNRCSQISDKVDQLKACLDTEFQETKLLIDNLSVCEQSITVSGPMTITAPGVYCLIADIDTGSLVIDADNVVLDLNNHTLTSNVSDQRVVEVMSGHTHITIKNGIVRVINAGLISTIGLFAEDCTNLVVQDISFEGNQSNNTTGIQLLSTQGFLVDRCSFTSFTTAVNHGALALGLATLAQGCRDGKISCCSISNIVGTGIHNFASANLIFDTVKTRNAGSGFRFILSTDCFLTHCSANNGTQGFATLLNSSNLFLLDCEANQNGIGFGLTGFRMILDNCTANNNVNFGINLSISDSFCIKNCIAKGNGIAGFEFGNITNSNVFHNVAVGNSVVGFNSAGGINNVFFSNYAEGNGTNYGVGVLPVTTFTVSTGTFTSTPTAWDNISAVS